MTSPQNATADLPPEIQLALRLESIFMPHARKQRDEHHAREAHEGGARFVHYTSAEAALSIIKSKRLWMRNTTCMADFREVQHGYDILWRLFHDEQKREAFKAALDVCAPGAADEAIKIFDQWWQTIRFSTFIASLSEHLDNEDFHGRLSMWRAFGNSGAPRVAAVIRIPKFSGGAIALNLIFSPVAYFTEAQTHDEIKRVICNITANVDFLKTIDRQTIVANVFTMLLAGVTCLKHEGFAEEREWRAIYSPLRSPSPFVESSTKVVSGVPQIIHKIPMDATVSPVLAELDLAKMFDRLIIGPSQYSWPMCEAFTQALKAAGVADAEKRVFISDIPIRT
jgi:hypothetical protein